MRAQLERIDLLILYYMMNIISAYEANGHKSSGTSPSSASAASARGPWNFVSWEQPSCLR